MPPRVRAAGGVVVRDGRVLVVHRPQYDDWTFPKGKLEPGESWEEAAVREVAEEAGVRADLAGVVGETSYVDAHGRDKVVRYYRMTTDDEPRARNEVDELHWVDLDTAATLLSYEPDRELLRRL